MSGGPEVGLIVAVKRLAVAKSRLAELFSAPDRERVVLAMLVDTLTAARAAGSGGSITVVLPRRSAFTTDLAMAARVFGESTARPNDFAMGANESPCGVVKHASNTSSCRAMGR